MSVTAEGLAQKHCKPCEGGVPPLSAAEVKANLAAVPQWQVTDDGKMIRRKYKFKDFVTAIAFLNKVGDVAEAEQHHPDLHLTGYRNAAVELTTHAIGGLSENDFVLAAKIDKLQA
jgi:4a-hydroxytetrahydrobiopterin dehydratase